jgi:hypothetical protein
VGIQECYTLGDRVECTILAYPTVAQCQNARGALPHLQVQSTVSTGKVHDDYPNVVIPTNSKLTACSIDPAVRECPRNLKLKLS